MAKQDNVFARAAKAAQKGTAAECRKLIAELEELQAKEQPILEAVRPPGQRITGGDGRVYGTLPTGERFERASLNDDRKAVAECIEEHDRLTARLDKAAALKHALKDRQANAAAEEAVAAAPKQAKAAVDALDGLLERHAAAIAEFNSVHTTLQATIDSLIEARKLDAAAPTLSLEQFYRAGIALAIAPPQRRKAIEGGVSTPARETRPLFGSTTMAVTKAKALVDVPKTVTDKLRELMGRRDAAGRGLDSSWRPDTSDRAVQERLTDWYRELCRLLAADDLGAGKALGPPRMKHGRPDFGEAA